jgi:predicted 3-demethylubiquinone-9 3-methyltransferase (glyoxalase superfamily)
MRRRTSIILLCSLVVLSCAYAQVEEPSVAKVKDLQAENDSLRSLLEENMSLLENRMITSLTFQDNNAEKAMTFYVELFDNSRIIRVERWAKGGPVEEGRIMQATFELNGNLFMCSDSPPVHDWDFTPAVSNYIECKDEKEIERLFTSLSEDGNVAMPLNNYGFSRKFGWVIDQFGISWQLNLE